MDEPRDVTGIEVLLCCPGCHWTGVVTLYDIGDGPEWCCRDCDMCWPSNPIIGEDGLTNGQRELKKLADHYLGARFGPPTDDDRRIGYRLTGSSHDDLARMARLAAEPEPASRPQEGG